MTCRICGADTGSSAEVCLSRRVDGKLKHSRCARAMMEWHDAVRTIERLSVDPRFRPPVPQAAAEKLIAAATRIRPDHAGAFLDAVEVIDAAAGHVDVPDPARTARRLDNARLRIESRAGLRARQRRRAS